MAPMGRCWLWPSATSHAQSSLNAQPFGEGPTTWPPAGRAGTVAYRTADRHRDGLAPEEHASSTVGGPAMGRHVIGAEHDGAAGIALARAG